ncbi:hypothetical protein RZS08_59290, partial [Arthrospira platensis SPKY1]|nr:hypothetical protein [Arthrospira platensis SPKY1]
QSRPSCGRKETPRPVRNRRPHPRRSLRGAACSQCRRSGIGALHTPDRRPQVLIIPAAGRRRTGS